MGLAGQPSRQEWRHWEMGERAKMTTYKFKAGEWYEFHTLPEKFCGSFDIRFSEPFMARDGKWAPYDAWFVNGRFEPVGHGSYRPTHWSPKEDTN